MRCAIVSLAPVLDPLAPNLIANGRRGYLAPAGARTRSWAAATIASESMPNSCRSDLNEKSGPSAMSFALVTVAVRTMSPDISTMMSTSPRIAFEPRAREQGFNSVLSTTHRQNFLVPPRRHRSFPLAEL